MPPAENGFAEIAMYTSKEYKSRWLFVSKLVLQIAGKRQKQKIHLTVVSAGNRR